MRNRRESPQQLVDVAAQWVSRRLEALLYVKDQTGQEDAIPTLRETEKELRPYLRRHRGNHVV